MTLPTASMSVTPEPEQAAPPSSPGRAVRVLDLALRVAGGALAVFGGALTAVVELVLAGVRVGGQLIGVSVLVAIVANVVLGWFAHVTVGRRWAVVLPAVPWFAMMVVAAGRTDEGDVLLSGNNWVGLAMIVAGAMTFAVAGFRLMLAPPTRTAK
ncbi:hypothetical protein GA0074694_0344 [Micromonospora inyonensis]|uniref:Uncharacterized protein n=3 Tax=Micromonosporaceae TaxID=28056 RepID=A0A1C6R8Q2_9ACTN|nr:hypothetical protein JD81_00759 [Micromonospora sagamiensis]BCL13835.1 hypothetical protein GCM10017556_15740 [Micromonospora sagamiensis]SCL13458.1 hypothetical protein GA0074694_0344 [Micromonospora inyonensis]